MGEWLDRYKAHLLAILVLTIAAGSALVWLRRPQPAPVQLSTPAPTLAPTPVPSATPAPLRVYVTGAVRQPDVYLLAPGSIVKDALAAAGGAAAGADLDRINLAVQLQDQQQVYVPRQGEGAPPAPPVAAASGVQESRAGSVGLAPSPALVNINTASQAELETLPGIGPKLAQEIIRCREHASFQSVDALDDVPGIGAKRLEAIRDLVTVQ